MLLIVMYLNFRTRLCEFDGEKTCYVWWTDNICNAMIWRVYNYIEFVNRMIYNKIIFNESVKCAL